MKSPLNKIPKHDQDVDMLDPDARFLLANERTLLAWVRTSLTLIAGGIAFNHFSNGSDWATTIGLLVVLLGGIMAVVGYQRFDSADKAIRAGQLPETGNGPAVQVIGVVVFCFALIIIEILMK